MKNCCVPLFPSRTEQVWSIARLLLAECIGSVMFGCSAETTLINQKLIETQGQCSDLVRGFAPTLAKRAQSHGELSWFCTAK